MPHVSRVKLPKKTEENLIRTLELVLTKIGKEEQTREFLFSLLSSTERVMLAKRLAIIVLLKEGVSDSEIAQTLHVTRVTVNKMHLLMQLKSTGFEAALKKIKEDENTQELRAALIKLAGYSIRAVGGRI